MIEAVNSQLSSTSKEQDLGGVLSPNLPVLYTPPACPMDSIGLSSDPAISDGLSGSLSEVCQSLLDTTGFHC